jgi:hypothetical protein
MKNSLGAIFEKPDILYAVENCALFWPACGIILDHPRPILRIGGVGQGGQDILPGEFGKIIEDFFYGHSRSQVAEDIAHGDPHVANAGLSAAFSGLDCDVLFVIDHFFRDKDLPVLRKLAGLGDEERNKLL